MTQKQIAIELQSLVSEDNFEPIIELRWGKQQTQLSTPEARKMAFSIFEIAAAEIDAKLVKWAITKPRLSPSEAAGVLSEFRQMRESNLTINVVICLDNEHVTPSAGKLSALDMLMLVATSEVEAMLAHFLIEKLQRSPEVAEQIVNEFRESL